MFSIMAKLEGYLPVSSFDEDIGTHSPNERRKPRFAKAILSSAVALTVLRALGLGYSLGQRHANATSASTIRKVSKHRELALKLTPHSARWRCALLYAVQQNLSPATER
jgi:hypothetical protein